MARWTVVARFRSRPTPRARCSRPRCCGWKSKCRGERQRAYTGRRPGRRAHGHAQPARQKERDRHTDDRRAAGRAGARRSRCSRARSRAARRRRRLLRRHGSAGAARVGGQDRRGKSPGRAALRRDLPAHAGAAEAGRGAGAGTRPRGRVRPGDRVRPGARGRVGQVRVSRGAARLRARDRDDTAQADRGGEGGIRPRCDRSRALGVRSRGAGPGVARVRGLGLRGAGRRGVAGAGGVERLGPRPHQAAVLPARRHALRGRHPARRRRQRRQPHHPRFPSRAPGVPEEMTGALRPPGAILLVSCYELGHQPLGLAWPRAFLERAGYAPETLDLAVEPFDAEKARRARLVAVSVPMHTALRLGVAFAERVRAVNPTCHIAFYGLYATLNADHLLSGVADSVLGGEADEALVELARNLERARDGAGGRGEAPSEWGTERRSLPPTPRTIHAKLDFPVPSRRGLPSLKSYAHVEKNGRLELAGYVEASRGCKHQCRHCPIPPVYGGRFFVVDRAVVLADVRQLVEAGATHVTFGDPDFLNGPRHALDVARALHQEFPSVTFDVTAKIEHLLRQGQHLPELASLGCLFIVSAVESLSDTVLAHLDKGHTRADVIAALEAVRATGITLRPTWVPFTPWTTLGDYREMLDFVEREALLDAVDPVQYSIRLLVPPGSLLANSEALRPHRGPLVEHDFYYRWTHPDRRMDRLQESVASRSEERRVGKECRSRWSPDH